jgi:hypothetical protein
LRLVLSGRTIVSDCCDDLLNEVPIRTQRQPKVGSQIDFLFIKLLIFGTVEHCRAADIPLTNLTNIVVLLPTAKSMKDIQKLYYYY